MTTNNQPGSPASMISGAGGNNNQNQSFESRFQQRLAESGKSSTGGNAKSDKKASMKGKNSTQGSQLGTAPTPNISNGATNASINAQRTASNPSATLGANPVQAATPTTPQYMGSQVQMAQPLGQVQSQPYSFGNIQQQPNQQLTYGLQNKPAMELMFGNLGKKL